jgi:hypothetical protein
MSSENFFDLSNFTNVPILKYYEEYFPLENIKKSITFSHGTNANTNTNVYIETTPNKNTKQSVKLYSQL